MAWNTTWNAIIIWQNKSKHLDAINLVWGKLYSYFCFTFVWPISGHGHWSLRLVSTYKAWCGALTWAFICGTTSSLIHPFQVAEELAIPRSRRKQLDVHSTRNRSVLRNTCVHVNAGKLLHVQGLTLLCSGWSSRLQVERLLGESCILCDANREENQCFDSLLHLVLRMFLGESYTLCNANGKENLFWLLFPLDPAKVPCRVQYIV